MRKKARDCDGNIIFGPLMIPKLLRGQKTMTRRLVNPQPVPGSPFNAAACPGDWSFPHRGTSSLTITNKPNGPDGYAEECAPHKVGHRLWIRERLRRSLTNGEWVYAADEERIWLEVGHPSQRDMIHWGITKKSNFCSPIHMPAWACRLEIIVKSVSLERVQAITPEDCEAEGILWFTKDGKVRKYWVCDPCDGPFKCTWQDLPRSPVEAFARSWDHVHGDGAWARNDWVWVYTFEKGNIDGKEGAPSSTASTSSGAGAPGQRRRRQPAQPA